MSMFNKLQKKHGEDFNWFEPSNKIVFGVELKKELTPLHALFGLTLKAIGKNDRNDDVLFTDGADFYIIHLTWATAAEDYPHYKKILADDIDTVLEQDYLHGK